MAEGRGDGGTKTKDGSDVGIMVKDSELGDDIVVLTRFGVAGEDTSAKATITPVTRLKINKHREKGEM